MCANNKMIESNTSRRSATDLFLSSLLLLAVILAGLTLTGCSSAKTIDLNPYITFETSGYDGYGTVTATFDQESFLADYADTIRVKTSKLSDEALGAYEFVSLFYEESTDAVFFTECFDGSLNQSSALSNGDTVTWSWICEYEEYASYFNCTAQYSDITYTVTGCVLYM